MFTMNTCNIDGMWYVERLKCSVHIWGGGGGAVQPPGVWGQVAAIGQLS